MLKSVMMLVILAITVFLYIKEYFSLAVTSMLSVTAIMAVGILSASEAFSCFSNDIVMLIAGMMFIVEAFWQSGLIAKIGSVFNNKKQMDEKNFVISLTAILAICSLFVNNSPLLTAFLPLVSAIVAASNGKITKKNTFMPMSFACLIGGCGSLAGSSLPGIVSSVLTEYGCAKFRFFETLPVSMVILLVILICYKTFLYQYLRKVFDFEEKDEMQSGTEHAETIPEFHRRNATVTIIIFLGCVVGFIITPFGWTVGQIAVTGAVALIVTGCIDGKNSLKRINWSILIVVGSTLGIAKGFVVSGAGELITNWLLSTFGDSMQNPIILLTVFMVTGYVLSMFMSNGSLCGMLAAVAIPLAVSLGQNPLPVAVGLSICCQQAMATPAASVTIALSQGGNYRFKDYMRVGGLVGTICFITGWLSIIVIYGLF